MEKIKRIDKNFKTMSIKGKPYVEVKERIKYLAFDFDGNYSIKTKFWYFPDIRTWVVKATLLVEQNGESSIYNGHAQEVESDSYKDVNHTSALENCETSAIGRACAMAGIGVDIAIASADEVNKAINRETHNKDTQTTQAANTTQDKPKESKAVEPPVLTLQEALKQIAAASTADEVKSIWNNCPNLKDQPHFKEKVVERGKELKDAS